MHGVQLDWFVTDQNVGFSSGELVRILKGRTVDDLAGFGVWEVSNGCYVIAGYADVNLSRYRTRAVDHHPIID